MAREGLRGVVHACEKTDEKVDQARENTHQKVDHPRENITFQSGSCL